MGKEINFRTEYEMTMRSVAENSTECKQELPRPVQSLIYNTRCIRMSHFEVHAFSGDINMCSLH